MNGYSYLNGKSRSLLSEKKAARILSGKCQPASGAMRSSRLKGDVTSERFLLEDKTSNFDSFPLKKATWLKIANAAYRLQKSPVLRVTIAGTTLYVLDETTFQEML